MSDTPYIAPSRKKSAQEKRTPEDGGKDGRAVYIERGDSLSVEVHPRQIRVTIKNED